MTQFMFKGYYFKITKIFSNYFWCCHHLHDDDDGCLLFQIPHFEKGTQKEDEEIISANTYKNIYYLFHGEVYFSKIMLKCKYLMRWHSNDFKKLFTSVVYTYVITKEHVSCNDNIYSIYGKAGNGNSYIPTYIETK